VRILIIEDEFLVRMGLGDDLSDLGFHVDGAATGAEAIAKLRSHQYSAIILDLHLPDRSGLDLLAEIRQLDGRLPVVLASGTSDEALDAAIRFDQVAYVRKPYAASQVEATLAILGVERAARQ
jgi:two-component system, OmpR family, response regulator QseB